MAHILDCKRATTLDAEPRSSITSEVPRTFSWFLKRALLNRKILRSTVSAAAST